MSAPPPPVGSGLSPPSSPLEPETKAAAAASPAVSAPAQAVRTGRTPQGHKVSTPARTAKTDWIDKLAKDVFGVLGKAAKSSSEAEMNSTKLALSAKIFTLKNTMDADYKSTINKVVRVVLTILTFGLIIPLYYRGKDHSHNHEMEQLSKLAIALHSKSDPDAALVQYEAAKNLEILKNKSAQQVAVNKKANKEKLRAETPKEFLEPLARLHLAERARGNAIPDKPVNNAWRPILHAVSQPQFIRDLYSHNPIAIKEVEGNIQPKIVKVEYDSEDTPSGIQHRNIKYIEVEYPDPEVSLTCRFGVSATGELEILNIRHSDKRIEMPPEAAQQTALGVLNDRRFARLGELTPEGISDTIRDTHAGVETPKLIISSQAARDINRVKQCKIEIDSDPPRKIIKDKPSAAAPFTYLQQLAEVFPSGSPPKVSPLVQNVAILHNQGLLTSLIEMSPSALNLEADRPNLAMGIMPEHHRFEATQGPSYVKLTGETAFSRTTALGPIRDKGALSMVLGYAVGTYEVTMPRAAMEKPLGSAIPSDAEGSKVVSSFKFFATQEEAQAYLDQNWDAAPNAVGEKYVASPEVAAGLMHGLLTDPNMHIEANPVGPLPDAMEKDFARIPNIVVKSGDHKPLHKRMGGDVGKDHSPLDKQELVDFLAEKNPRKEKGGANFGENVMCYMSQSSSAPPMARFLEQFKIDYENTFPAMGDAYHVQVDITADKVEIETLMFCGIKDDPEGEPGRYFVSVLKRSVPLEVLQKDHHDITGPEELIGSTYTQEFLEFDSEESAKAFIEKRVQAFAKVDEAEAKAKASEK